MPFTPLSLPTVAPVPAPIFPSLIWFSCALTQAASNPNALPPLSKTAWIDSLAALGLSSSVSLEAGPSPRTSTPVGASCSHIITVQPVAASIFWAVESLTHFRYKKWYNILTYVML